MPHEDNTADVGSRASEQPAAFFDRGILNTVECEGQSVSELEQSALHFYQQLSDKQRAVLQAKQRTEERLASITHADTKVEQVDAMDRQVMSGAVFRQAARLAVAEAGYDGAERGKEQKERLDSQQREQGIDGNEAGVVNDEREAGKDKTVHVRETVGGDRG